MNVSARQFEARPAVRVIDFETTGMPPEAAVCEVAWVDLAADGAISAITSEIVNPGRAIAVEAMAVHHIREADVIGKRSPDAAFLDLSNGADVFCAHNAAFERQFFTGGGKPWICTYKGALRVWPDAPSHSNQVLRYWLGLELDEALAMPPHRAGPDTYVTAHILNKLMAAASVEQLIGWTEQPALLTKCRFGKHRGKPWSEVPADYLQWMLRQTDMDADALFTARHHLKIRSAA